MCSAPHRVHFLDLSPASALRTRRFTEPTFPQHYGKKYCFATLPFRVHSFSSSLLFFPLLHAVAASLRNSEACTGSWDPGIKQDSRIAVTASPETCEIMIL